MKVLVANLDDKDKNIMWNELNQTLLHLAAKEGHIEIVKYLSGFLTDINPSSSSGGCNYRNLQKVPLFLNPFDFVKNSLYLKLK